MTENSAADVWNVVAVVPTFRPDETLIERLDALAPVVGAASTLLFTVPPDVLVLYLGFFAGFLLYIGVSDILPEAHSGAHPARAPSA